VKTDVRGPYVEFDNRPPPKWQGILQNDPVNPVRAASVRDGLSLTFLMFESAGRPESYINGRKNPESQTITAFRWASPDISIQINNTCGNGQIINCHNNGEVYGFHRDGANIVFADGSLHFVSQHIDPETFVSLYTIAGGDVVSESELGL
jgi:prepilin-type processing-associated H-X9-DG protein